MSKLNYPSDGIYKYCRSHIENCSSNLSKANSNCSFSIPYDFGYRNYLNGLNNTLSNYIKTVNSIDSKLQKINNNFEDLSSDLSSNTKNMTSTKIKDRDRMIG